VDAEALLAAHDPVSLAAAVLRLHRRQLPPPAVISQPYQPTPQQHTPQVPYQAKPRAEEDGPPPSDFAQFRIAVGRNHRADPKWLVPLLCRLGGITKRDIGSIRVFDTDTRFEINRAVSDAFAAAVADMPANEAKITSAGEGPMPARSFRPKGARVLPTHLRGDGPPKGKRRF
jgi:ATP-dependent RNA helicase DeaD